MKHIEGCTSYEFMAENLWEKPALYKRSFDSVKGYVKFLQSFEDLRHLSSFLSRARPETDRIRTRLIRQLYRLARKMPALRNAVLEVLLFARKDQIVPVGIDDPKQFDEVFYDNLMRYVFLDTEKVDCRETRETTRSLRSVQADFADSAD